MSCASSPAIKPITIMNPDSKIYIAGHRGLVGSAIVRCLEEQGYSNLVMKTHAELDLTDQSAVEHFFYEQQPEYIFLAAAKVGGINANNIFPAEFIYNNLQIQSNIIHASWKNNVKRLLFLGSSCIYPKLAEQPIKEEYLLSGQLEPTNEPYAIAKIAGIKMCESYNRQYGTDFRSVMPTNLYGPGDNFDLKTSHVLPALLRKFDEAKQKNAKSVSIWGSGVAKREFLYVDDMADACVYIMNIEKQIYRDVIDERCSHINIGTGIDISISELARKIRDVIKVNVDIVYDSNIPDGTPRKVLDVSKLGNFGWKADTSLDEGIERTYEWYQKHKKDIIQDSKEK